MKINNLFIVGLIFIIIGILLFFTDALNPFIRPFTHIFLMGSSKGKDIIFFLLMGSMLLISPIFTSEGYLKRKLSEVNYFSKWQGNDFLKIVIIALFSAYIMGLILEILVRLTFGVSIFTTFVSLVPTPSSSSIVHSHIFKAVLSPFLSSLIASGSTINTGKSLIQYISPIGLLVLIIMPLVYVMGLFSLGDRRDIHKFLVILGLSTSLIGIIDGSLFSAPALIGLSILLGTYSFKIPFSFKNLIKPSIIIFLLLSLRVFLGLIGSNTEYYEVTIIGATEPIELEGYPVTYAEVQGQKTILHIAPTYNEIFLLNALSKSLEGKCSGFFISWNFFSFFGPDYIS
jgi:hypothetical protein